MVGFVKELIDELARKGTIEKIIYFKGIAFVYKKLGKLNENINRNSKF